MSSTSALESGEDLENVPLVRMEDVQPDRDRSDGYCRVKHEEEILETSIVDYVDYETECVVDDDDSNIGSMVLIKDEDVCDNSGGLEMITVDAEFITPDLDEPVVEVKTVNQTKLPDQWPTLEILPGGVIKNLETSKENLNQFYTDSTEQEQNSDKIFACAKCPQKYRTLFCLVKHVKLHTDSEKKAGKRGATKLTLQYASRPKSKPTKLVLKQKKKLKRS